MRFDDIRTRLSGYTVGIAGAGGLGSNCAVALARTGVGCLVIADYDIVEAGNLNRQYFFLQQIGMKKVEALRDNLLGINTEIKVDIFDAELNRDNIPGIFEKCDIIVEAFDRADMKEMLAETVLSTWPDRYLILGSGLAGYGKNNELRQRNVGARLIVCGDENSETSEAHPPLAPRVGIVANMQANAVLEILLNKL